jgi:predicted ester cyclase
MSTSDAHALVLRWIGAFNDRDLDACGRIVAAAFVEHATAPFGREPSGAVDGPAHLREAAEWLLAQFPDLLMTVMAVAVEGDTVAVRVRSEGTNLGPLNGVVPPTGRRFSTEQSHWFRIRDGRLAEHWATRDDLGTMLQLGVLQPPGPPASWVGPFPSRSQGVDDP